MLRKERLRKSKVRKVRRTKPSLSSPLASLGPGVCSLQKPDKTEQRTLKNGNWGGKAVEKQGKEWQGAKRLEDDSKRKADLSIPLERRQKGERK